MFSTSNTLVDHWGSSAIEQLGVIAVGIYNNSAGYCLLLWKCLLFRNVWESLAWKFSRSTIVMSRISSNLDSEMPQCLVVNSFLKLLFFPCCLCGFCYILSFQNKFQISSWVLITLGPARGPCIHSKSPWLLTSLVSLISSTVHMFSSWRSLADCYCHLPAWFSGVLWSLATLRWHLCVLL